MNMENNGYIAIIDYGVGNLFSLRSSFGYIGKEARVTGDVSEIRESERIVLPGVGAFGDAVKALRESRLDSVIIEEARRGKPLLGVCLGMQMLFERSYEYGIHEGLGLVGGEVRTMRGVIPDGLKIPQMGWNALHFPVDKPKCPLFKYTEDGANVYFVHSYAGMSCGKSLAAYTEYGVAITAAVAEGNVFGTQFHPEKSGEVGLGILRAFCEL